MAVDGYAIFDGDVSRMDPEDAKRVLGEVLQFLDEQKRLNAESARKQGLLAQDANATLSQREQAKARSAAFGVAARAHHIGQSHLVMRVKMANSARDRHVLGDPPAPR